MSDAAPQAAKPQVVRSHRAMDTAFTVTIQSDDAALATSAAEAAFARIDAVELSGEVLEQITEADMS